MSLQTALTFGFLLGMSIVLEADSHCINNESGKDEERCVTQASPTLCCESLQFLFSMLEKYEITHDLKIQIQSNTTLNDVLAIEGYTNLTLQGEDSSTLKCSSKDAGIYIRNVDMFEVCNLTITGCSMVQYSSTIVSGSNEEVCCAVYILNSTDLTIKNTVFQSQQRNWINYIRHSRRGQYT